MTQDPAFQRPRTIEDRIGDIQHELQQLSNRLERWRLNAWLALWLVGWALALLTFK